MLWKQRDAATARLHAAPASLRASEGIPIIPACTQGLVEGSLHHMASRSSKITILEILYEV